MGRTRPKRCEAVLIVEDEPLIAMDIEWMLTREGWAVLGPFRSVGEVLHLLKDTRPDAAVLDYNVCGEAITPVAERLRALDVPMVVSSADFPLNAPLSEVCEALRDAKSIGKPIDERRLFDALTSAAADDMANVQTFYDLLSNPGSETHVAAFLGATSENWESVGDYSGENEGRDGFVGQMGFFSQLIPDLNWSVQAMHQDGDFVTVRSRATGTPTGPFFGVDGEGRSFDILTIDIHELDDGVVVRTYHVEDWASALQQLSGR